MLLARHWQLLHGCRAASSCWAFADSLPTTNGNCPLSTDTIDWTHSTPHMIRDYRASKRWRTQGPGARKANCGKCEREGPL